MASVAHRQIIGGGGASIIKNLRRRPQIGGGVRPAQGSSTDL